MPEDIKRMRYYNGLFLQQEEFQLEQDYNVRRRRIHNARLHGKGIVWGLDVKVGTVADSVIVEQGMALDYYHEANDAEYQSREIVVVQETPVDLSQYAGDDEVWLWIRYDESPAGDDPDRGDQPFNTIERFQIEHSLTRPVNEDLNIILARIVVNSDDTIDENSISYDDPVTGLTIRIGSGVAGPRVETDQLTLRAPTTAAPWAYMTGNEFDPGGPNRAVGINVVSERTRFTGPVDVEGNLDVQNDLIVQQNSVLTGDLNVQQNVTVTGTIDSNNPSGAVEVADDLHVAGNLSLLAGPAVNEISTDNTLADASDTALPTEQAVRTFVETKIQEFVNNELVGSVVSFALETPPVGWLECDGSDVSRTTYADLFAKIGVSYGAGDGSNTFGLPDLRGQFVRGWDHGAGQDPDAASRTDRGDGTTGDAVGTLQGDQMQGHTHSDSGHSHGSRVALGNLNAPVPAGSLNELSANGSTGTASANLGNPVDAGTGDGAPRYGIETRGKNVALMYCIKH